MYFLVLQGVLSSIEKCGLCSLRRKAAAELPHSMVGVQFWI